MLAGTGIFLVGVALAVLAAFMFRESPKDDAEVIGLVGMIVLAMLFIGGGIVLTWQAGLTWDGVN